MSDSKPSSGRIVQWFRGHVRAVLQKSEPPGVVEELDKLAAQVEQVDERRLREFPICLLGQAGVGKSTLINTLIADNDIVVPSGGGTGPLTASALRVSYGEEQSFTVKYHTIEQLNQLRFVLETQIQRQAKQDAASPAPRLDGDTDDIELDAEEQKRSRFEEAVGRARLLIAGSQTAPRELTYLVDAIRFVLRQESKFKSELLPDDIERLRQIEFALEHNTSPRNIDSTDADFRQRLRDHACGFLAPLIQEMSIRWPSPLLRESVELVDLPGIGILNDAYTSVTSDYLRNRAKAVMLVTNDRGLRREDAELLKTSGFLNRLLHSSDDLTEDPVVLMVVVVRIDDVAVENWMNDRATHGTALKSKAQHFSEQAERCRGDVGHRLQSFLREVWDDDTEGKRLVIQSILDNLMVFPVSAPQYRLHHSTDPDDDKSFLPSEAATNIVALRSAIAEVARRCVAEQERRSNEVRQRFFDQLRARLEVLSAQREQERHAGAQIQKFKDELDEFISPRQREFDTRRGSFRNFLRKTVPTEITAKVESASTKARKDIQGDLRKLEDAHWKTLQAAVRKEGTFHGQRHINLPHDFALRFESPIAEVWSREILVSIRRETKEFAEFQSDVVTQVLDWARAQGLRGSTRLLEALVEAVKLHRQQVNAVGKEAVDELRDKVRAELIKKIEPHIRRRCQKFVAENKHVGTGVKRRMLDLFNDLGDEIVTAAAAPASTLLVDRFKEVDKEILAAFGEHSDPLSEAAEALVQKQEKVAGREEEQLATAIESAVAAMPSVNGEEAH